ncbi:MAG: hypothetical protein ACYDH2_03430 [Anaerolineaceae bacterium]
MVSSVWEDASLSAIYDINIPAANPIDIQRRLYGKAVSGVVVEGGAEPLTVGAARAFWIANGAEEQTSQVTAYLRAVSANLYVWVQEGLYYDPTQLDSLTTSFEDNIYMQMRSFFGEQWDPGVDGDPHIYLLYASGIGVGAGGYFSSVDEYPSSIFPSSNEVDMITVNADEIPLSGKAIERVVSHEFQHMIHFSKDVNEDVWVNEGLSEYAVFASGIKDLRLAQQYMNDPDRQLTFWENPTEGMANAPLYGQVFLFTSYFVERFGLDALTALVKNPANGIVGYEEVLRDLPQKGSDNVEFNDVFFDWSIANYLQDPSIEDGQYDYEMSHGMAPSFAGDYETCSDIQVSETVHQYGVDYYKFSCPGSYTLTFQGSEYTRLFSPSAHSLSYVYWSNSADNSDMTLTKAFDLTDALNPYMSYFTWYVLETNRDYVYVEVSADGGNTWTFVEIPEAFAGAKSNSEQWGLTGTSDGWIEKQINLSKYAGQKVLVRFEYITDSTIQKEGFLIDDISLPALAYSCDFEADSCGWEADGFVRTQAFLPQIYRLAILDGSGQNRATEVPLTGKNVVSVTLTVGRTKPVVFVVAAGTPFSRDLTNYSFNVSEIAK